MQLPQVHRYSFAGGSVEIFAGLEAVARLSIEVESEGWRYHECEGRWTRVGPGVGGVPFLSLSLPLCWLDRGR